MALRCFRKIIGPVNEARDLVVRVVPPLKMSSRAQGMMLALLIAVGVGGFGAVGYAGAQSVDDGGAEPVRSPESDSIASGPVDVAAPEQDSPRVPVLAQDQPSPANHATEIEGNVAELQRMLIGGDLTELRTTYNGSYGSSLLLSAKGRTYYIALVQQKSFWRVIKTSDKDRAEAIYAEFVRKSAQLADVEVRRAELASDMADTDRLIALAQARAERLQADIEVAHQQQQLFTSRQKKLREETAELDSQRRAAQDQLRKSRRHGRRLQREAEQGLPQQPQCRGPQDRVHRGCR